jgi:hypothetical protein
MTMRDLVRAAVLIAFWFSMSCAAQVLDSSDTQRAGASDVEEHVASTEAALSGSTSHCLDSGVLRWQWTYPDNAFQNMQTFSKDLPAAQRDWWNRTDCAALIVDWVRNPAIGREGVEGFIAGIIDPSLTTSANCPYLRLSQKIVTHTQTSSGQWVTRVNKDEPGCDSSHLWMGQQSPSPGSWWRYQSPVRVIVQGFYSVWPVPVSAYVQTDTDSGFCPAGFCCTLCPP